MAWKRKDIQEFMLQDQARGQRRVRGDPDKVQERRDLRRDMKTLLEINDEEAFVEALVTDYGLRSDSEQYRVAVMIWRVYQRNP